MNDRDGDATSGLPDDVGLDVAYRCSSRVLSRRVGDELFVAPATGEPYLLTGTGLAIWDLLGTPRTLPELVRDVSAVYGSRPAAIASDVRTFVADLVSRGLVEEAGHGAP